MSSSSSLGTKFRNFVEWMKQFGIRRQLKVLKELKAQQNKDIAEITEKMDTDIHMIMKEKYRLKRLQELAEQRQTVFIQSVRSRTKENERVKMQAIEKMIQTSQDLLKASKEEQSASKSEN